MYMMAFPTRLLFALSVAMDTMYGVSTCPQFTTCQSQMMTRLFAYSTDLPRLCQSLSEYFTCSHNASITCGKQGQEHVQTAFIFAKQKYSIICAAYQTTTIAPSDTTNTEGSSSKATLHRTKWNIDYPSSTIRDGRHINTAINPSPSDISQVQQTTDISFPSDISPVQQTNDISSPSDISPIQQTTTAMPQHAVSSTMMETATTLTSEISSSSIETSTSFDKTTISDIQISVCDFFASTLGETDGRKLCSVNQTFSQLISQCEELNQCNNKLIEVLSSGNLIVCRTLLVYIPCMQGLKKKCRNVDIDDSVNEYLAFAAETYNRSNCSEVLKEITTSLGPPDSTRGTSGGTFKGFQTTHFTRTPVTRTTGLVSEVYSSPREVSPALHFTTSGQSEMTDEGLKNGVSISPAAHKTEGFQFSKETRVTDKETSLTPQRFTATKLSTKGLMSSKMTTVDPTGFGTKSPAARRTSITSRRPTRRTVRTPSMTSSNSDKTSSTMWPSRRSSSGSVKITVADRTGRPTEPSASFSYPDDMEPPTAELSTKGLMSSKMTTVDPTGFGTKSPATRRTSITSRRPTRRTVRTPSMTSSNSDKTSSTMWPSRRSSSGSVKITVADRTGRPTEPSASFSYPDDMEPPTAGVSSRQCVYLPTIALVTISHVIVA